MSADAMAATLGQLATLSVLELTMALSMMRDGRAGLDDLAADVSSFVGVFLEPAEIEPCRRRMIERGWFAPHPHEPDHLLVTQLGEAITYAGFASLIRAIDDRRGHFELAIMWSLARRSNLR